MLAGIGRDPPIESDFVYRASRRALNLVHMKAVLPLGLDWETCDRARLARDPAFDGIFYWRADNPNLLPPRLQGALRKIRECSILRYGRCRRAGRLSAMLALQTRNRTGEPRVERDCNHCRSGYAADRGRISR
jgi:hypothetical protein